MLVSTETVLIFGGCFSVIPCCSEQNYGRAVKISPEAVLQSCSHLGHLLPGAWQARSKVLRELSFALKHAAELVKNLASMMSQRTSLWPRSASPLRSHPPTWSHQSISKEPKLRQEGLGRGRSLHSRNRTFARSSSNPQHYATGWHVSQVYAKSESCSSILTCLKYGTAPRTCKSIPYLVAAGIAPQRACSPFRSLP